MYIEMSLCAVHLKLTRYCKSTIQKLKKNLGKLIKKNKRKKKKNLPSPSTKSYCGSALKMPWCGVSREVGGQQRAAKPHRQPRRSSVLVAGTERLGSCLPADQSWGFGAVAGNSPLTLRCPHLFGPGVAELLNTALLH